MATTLTYIRRDNEIVYPPPYQQAGTFLTAWLLGSPRAKQQALIDTQLNACSGGTPFEYRALLDSVILVLADIERVSSLDPTAEKLGWIPEQDICIWSVCGAYAEVDGERRLDHLAFFVPYIWVTNADTMATGREVFGYPKAIGWAQLPRDPEDRGPLWADGLVLSTFGPETEVVQRRILTLSREQNAGEATRPAFGAAQKQEAFESIGRMIAKRGGCDWSFCGSLLSDFLGRHLPMVFLKQFRSAASSDEACYQAIVEANATVNDFRCAGLLPSGWQLELESYASVDIPGRLGIAASQTVDLGFWVRFSFSMDLAREVWSAGGAT